MQSLDEEIGNIKQVHKQQNTLVLQLSKQYQDLLINYDNLQSDQQSQLVNNVDELDRLLSVKNQKDIFNYMKDKLQKDIETVKKNLEIVNE